MGVSSMAVPTSATTLHCRIFGLESEHRNTAVEFVAGPGVTGSLSGRAFLVGRAGYEWQEGRFRLRFTAIDFDHDFEPNSPDFLPGNSKFFAPAVSAQVNLEEWSFTAEYLRISFDRRESSRNSRPTPWPASSW